MPEQTYISKLMTKEGKMVDFERWPYKRVSTVEKKAVALFKVCSSTNFYRSDKVDNITIVDNQDNIVKVIPL